MENDSERSSFLPKAAWVVPILLGLMFGLCTHVLLRDGSLVVRSPALWLLCVAFPALFCLLFWASDCALDRIRVRGVMRADRPDRRPDMRLRAALPLGWCPRNVVIGALVIFAAWLPYLVSLYPGVVWFDTSAQIMWFSLPEPISLHHPLFDTVLICAFVRAAGKFLGDPLVGVFALVVAQSLLAAVALSFESCYLSRLGVPWGVRFATLAFFALFPGFPWFFATLVKDTLSAPFFVAYCVALQEVVRTRGRCLSNPRWSALAIVSVVILCLTKKTSSVFVVLSAGITLFCVACVLGCAVRRELAGVSVIVACVAAAILVPNLFNFAFVSMTGRETFPGGRQEAMSVPLQMVANVVQQDPGFFSEEERKTIDKDYLMGFDGIVGAYTWRWADGVKQYSEPPEADYGDLALVCMRAIVCKPRMCLEAWCGLNVGWFSFPATQDLVYNFNSTHTDDGYKDYVEGRTGTLMEEEMTELREAAGSLPVLGVLLRKCVWASIVPALCTFLVMRRSRGWRSALIGLAALLPLLLSVAMLLLGPLSIGNGEAVRYVAPMMCVAPLWLCMAATFADWSKCRAA